MSVCRQQEQKELKKEKRNTLSDVTDVIGGKEGVLLFASLACSSRFLLLVNAETHRASDRTHCELRADSEVLLHEENYSMIDDDKYESGLRRPL